MTLLQAPPLVPARPVVPHPSADAGAPTGPGRRLGQHVLVVAMAVGGAAFVATQHRHMVDAVASLGALSALSCTFAAILVVLSVLNRGAEAMVAYRLMGLPAPARTMVCLSARTYSANKVVRSGGAVGLALHLADARRRELSGPHVVGAYLCIKVFSTVAMCLVVTGAVATMFLAGRLHGPMLVAAIAGSGWAVVVLTSVVLVARSRTASERLWSWGADVVDRVRARGRRPIRPSSRHQDLFDAVHRIRTEPVRALPQLLIAMAAKLLSALLLCVVATGMGIHMTPVTVLVVYTGALLASMVGPLPGGIGMAEASMAALLMAEGVPASLAASAVFTFRLLDLWLPLLLGGLIGLLQRRAGRVDTRADPIAIPGARPAG